MFLSKVQFFLYVICLFDICLHLLEINVSQWKINKKKGTHPCQAGKLGNLPTKKKMGNLLENLEIDLKILNFRNFMENSKYPKSRFPTMSLQFLPLAHQVLRDRHPPNHRTCTKLNLMKEKY